MIVPGPQPLGFWQQLILATWHDALLVIGPLVTAAWAMRSNRQHKNNEKKVDSLTNGGLRNAVLAALREHEAGKNGA
jgi:hypothetical protein